MNTLNQQNAQQEMIIRTQTDADAALQENGLVTASGTEEPSDHSPLPLPTSVESELTVMELNAGDYDPGF